VEIIALNWAVTEGMPDELARSKHSEAIPGPNDAP
jgi:hypothetical protein